MTSDVKPSVDRQWVDLGVVLCVALATVLCSLAIPDNARAATIVVNSLADTVVSGDGVCTLREAILNADGDTHSSTDCAAGSGADSITFSISGTISLGSSLGISSAGGLTIDGGRRITISFIAVCNAITVESAGVLTLKHLTLADGNGCSSISNGGTLTLSHSRVSGNFSDSGDTIQNSGTMTISHSTVSNNSTLVSCL